MAQAAQLEWYFKKSERVSKQTNAGQQNELGKSVGANPHAGLRMPGGGWGTEIGTQPILVIPCILSTPSMVIDRDQRSTGKIPVAWPLSEC